MKKNIKKVIGLLFLFICVFSNNVYSSNKYGNINFQSITIDDGLSQSLAEYIYQDSLGYIWIGTNDGLNRYNGNEFKVYKNIKNDENTISNNMISSLVEDSDKNLWIGTDGGLNKMNLNTGEITRYLVSEEDKLYSNTVVDELLIDSKGRLWVCTINGLNLYDSENDNFIKVASDYLENKGIQDIIEDGEGNIWVSTRDGLFKYNHEKKSVESFYHDENDKNTISENNIFSLHYSNNELWIGTKTGGLNIMNLKDYSIKKYVHDSNNPKSIPSNLIRDIIRDKDGNIWLATDQGLASFDEKNETFYTYKKNTDKYSICDDNVINLYQDNLGVIWVGTFGGVSKFFPNNDFRVYRNDPTDNNSLSSSSVCGIYEDDEGNVWIGTFNAGVNKVSENEVTRFFNDVNESNSLSSNRIKDITGIGNEIWIATDNGLNKYDKATGRFTVYKKTEDENSVINNEIRVLHIDKDGILWIGTRGGISTLDRQGKFTSYNEVLEKNGVYEKTVSAIYEDSEGIMWFGLGNDGGLVKYNKETGEVKNYLSDDNKNSLSFNNVRSISEDSSGNIWIGTQDGLNKLNKNTEEFTVYLYNDGLSNSFIYGVLVDDYDNIWATTNYGLSMYDQSEDKFVRYYEADGLATNEFNGFSYHKNKNGEIYVGGVNGVTKFNPLELQLKMGTSNVIVDSIKTSGGTEVTLRDNVVLEYDSRELYIKFFIPEYKNMSQMQYAYKLEGMDSEWEFSGTENYARYANLPPGKYKMLMAGRNYNGVWSDVSSVDIKVKNSIFKTPVAYYIYIFILFGIIYFFYNQVKILDSLVTQRTQELNNKLHENKKLYKRLIEAEQYKNNYFVNLSHELRTPLNVILSIEQLIRSLVKSGKRIDNEKMEGYMNTLGGNSKRLLNLINNIIDTSKIDSGSYKLNKEETDIVSLVEDTALSMVELARSKGIELIVDPEIEELTISCDKLDIERCIVNLIGNAIKFTESEGTITVAVDELEDKVRISVKDTGVGIDEKYHKSIFDRFGQVYDVSSEDFGGSGLGLTLTRNLINLHGGEIKVFSKVGEGSEFIILLPIE
ncbi:histidine kinase [Clostridium sp. NSJ-6]|uniref:histidine kinase n=1 Tax=Clostridium hominis TaxID=2763036 RepID=A0ABR7DI58_9CLOT|nr:sensor histidine kinase [Clostridium hominis]MBC5631125.1 histidine kinase [Clostridium hominis]MDU2671206.1 two-component regulator propeller domain-containing protein [Clostridium sp.]